MRHHPSVEVNQALTKLADALCQWERETGRQNVLILRELGDSLRYDCGKPVTTEDVSDTDILKLADK